MENPFTKRVKAAERQSRLKQWLGGEGPFTDGELEEINKFKGSGAQLAAQQTISSMRRLQLHELLNQIEPLSPKEVELAGRFSGPQKDLATHQALSSQRKRESLNFLSGDDED